MCLYNMQRTWSKERTLKHLKKHHPWLTQEQINEYMGLPGAYERSQFIRKLKYWISRNVGAVSNTPSEAEWELIPPERANAVTTFDKQLNIVLKPNIKITRNPSTGRVQYWRKVDV